MYRAGIWFFFVTVIDQAISILVQPFINRIMSVEQIGVYSVYNTWHSILNVIVTFNLFCGVLEIYVTKYKKDKKQVVGSLLSLCLTIFAVCCVIFGVFILDLSKLFALKPIYIFFMMLSIISTAIVQFWCVPKRFEYEYKLYAVVVVSLFLVKSVLSVSLSYFLKADPVLGRILGMTIPSLAVAIVLLFVLFHGVKLKTINKYWVSALRYNIPLIPHYLSSILLSSSDKIMIQRMSGEYEAGLYSIAFSFSSLCLVVFNALNSAYTPYAYKAILDHKYENLAKRTMIITVFAVSFSILLMAFAPEGIFILGGEKYKEAIEIIPALIIGVYLSSFYFIFSNVEFVYEVTKYVFPITLVGSGLNILLNYLLIPRFGYQIAAYTTIAGHLVIAILHGLVASCLVKKDIYQLKKLALVISVLFASGIALSFAYRLGYVKRYILYMAVISIAIIIYLKKYKGYIQNFRNNRDIL